MANVVTTAANSDGDLNEICSVFDTDCFLITISLQGRYSYYSQFADEETEAERVK